MAQQKSGFISGANAKIKIGQQTMAYCTDVSYSIAVATVPVEVIGKYEILSNEPIAYVVEGSMNVIRYTSQAKKALMTDAKAKGNSLRNVVPNTGSGSNLQDHLNPARLLSSETFDIELQERYATGSSAGEDTIEAEGWIKFVDCRLTRRSAGLNKRGILVETIGFVGRLAQDIEDSQAQGAATPGDTDMSIS